LAADSLMNVSLPLPPYSFHCISREPKGFKPRRMAGTAEKESCFQVLCRYLLPSSFTQPTSLSSHHELYHPQPPSTATDCILLFCFASSDPWLFSDQRVLALCSSLDSYRGPGARTSHCTREQFSMVLDILHIGTCVGTCITATQSSHVKNESSSSTNSFAS
jgi:hypothetical protein